MAEYILFEYKRRRIWKIAEGVILPRWLSVSHYIYHSMATLNRRTLFFNDFHKAFISSQVLEYFFSPLWIFSFILEKKTSYYLYLYIYIFKFINSVSSCVLFIYIHFFRWRKPGMTLTRIIMTLKNWPKCISFAF